MNKTTRIRILTTALILAGASAASAQSPAATPIFISLNGGGQSGSRSIETSSSSPLFGETLQINSAQSISSGPLIDASVGYRFPRGLGVAVGYSTFGRSSDAALAASVPDPLLFNKPTAKTATATGLKHIENTWHIMAMWFFPVTEKIDVAIFAGPSFITVNQDVAVGSGANLTVTADRQKATAKGFQRGRDRDDDVHDARGHRCLRPIRRRQGGPALRYPA